MADARNVPWPDVVEALHALLTTIVVRGHYPAGHPAIERADEVAVATLAKVSVDLQELVVAIIENEFVVAERPMPELRERLAGFSDILLAHGIERLVLVRGVQRAEVSALASALAGPPVEDAARARERLQSQMPRILMRYAALRENAEQDEDPHAPNFVPLVGEMLAAVADSIARNVHIDEAGVRSVARQLFERYAARAAPLSLRSFDPSDDGAGHATNTAIMTCAMLVETGATDDICIDGVAAALLHDVGCMLLPEEIRGKPEPLLDERGRKMYRFHPILGGRALLLAGAPGTWVETALQHHRGVDLGGYPTLDGERPPHDLSRVVALANFVERKRTSLAGVASEPEGATLACQELLGKYFDRRCIGLWLRAMGIFPPGTTVELSTGEDAIVTRVNTGEPLRPRVRLLFGHDAGKSIDLREYNAVERRYARSIVRAISPPLSVIADAK